MGGRVGWLGRGEAHSTAQSVPGTQRTLHRCFRSQQRRERERTPDHQRQPKKGSRRRTDSGPGTAGAPVRGEAWVRRGPGSTQVPHTGGHSPELW